MARTLLLIGTRKGAFLLESENRRDWELRGPLCESWPVYHAIHDSATGAMYAAAASEWHGSAVWRSTDGGETWALSSTLAGQPGRELWDDPANQPPGHLGISALMTDDADAAHFWAIV